MFCLGGYPTWSAGASPCPTYFRLVAAERWGRRSLRVHLISAHISTDYRCHCEPQRGVAISRYAGTIRWQKKMCSDPPWSVTIGFTRRFPRSLRSLGMTGSGDCAFILLGRFRRLVGGVRQHPTKYSPNSIRRADHSDQSSEPKGCHSTTRPPERIVSGDSPPGRIRQQIPHKIPGFLRRKSLTFENILL